MPRRVVSAVVCSLLMVTVWARPAAAARTAIRAEPPEPLLKKQEKIIDDVQALETFLDEFFDREMTRLNIPGAVFILVEDGEVVFKKGYGFADLDSGARMNPDKTLVRVASISKLFTATAAMQLYEQGRLDLHEDVNKYLTGFQLEEKFDTPVTMHHLLTHTGGFDDTSIDLAYTDAAEVPSLEEYLIYHMPPRVMPPGEMISYSNHGLGLAGLVVEEIAGEPFVEYAQQNILQPLEMHRSSFMLPEDLAPDLATGHFPAGSYNRPMYFDYLYNIAPAASLNATAEDMANFMIAHLQEGRFDNHRILKESTVEEMHRRQFTHHPEMAGVAYGFFERYDNNRRFLTHSGLWGGFASLLFLYPQGDLGFFVSLNSNVGDELHGNLAEEFVDTFLPVEEEERAMTPDASFQGRAGAYLGNFRPVRYSRYSLEKMKVLSEQCRTFDPGDGTLCLEPSASSGEDPAYWTEAGPLFFRQVEGEEGLAFRRDEQGRITHLFRGTLAMERVPWYESAALHRAAGVIFLLLFASAWIGWPMLMLRGRREGKKAYAGRRERWLAGGAAFLSTVFLVGFLYFMASRAETLVYGVPPVLAGLLFLPLPAAVLAAASLWGAARVWREKEWDAAGRLHYSLVVLALVLFIPFLKYWNLLGIKR